MKPRAFVAALRRMPILALTAGPPLFRFGSTRDAYASLEQGADTGTALRIVWWLVFGALAIRDLRQNGIAVGMKASPWITAGSLLLLLTLLTSTIVSPFPQFTVANVALAAILMIAALDAATKLALQQIQWPEVERTLLWIFAILLGIVGVLTLIRPETVAFATPGGIRVMGGTIVNVPVAAAVLLLISLSRLLRSAHGWRANSAFVTVAFAFVLLARTRWVYAVLFVTIPFLFLSAWRGGSRHARQASLAIAVLFAIVISALLMVAPTELPDELLEYIIRDRESLTTASGRFGIAEVLLDASRDAPLGLGYVAGPRLLLQESGAILSYQGVVAERIGNAHNMYLEVLAGAGWAAAVAFAIVLVATAFRLLRLRGNFAAILAVVFATLVLEGFVSSSGALPLTQSSCLLWLVIGAACGSARAGDRSVGVSR